MTDVQIAAFWDRLRTSIVARVRNFHDSTITRDLHNLTPEQERQIVEVALNLAERLKEGRLP